MSEKQKILLVDDEPRNIRIFQLSLGDSWDTQIAENGEKAIAIASTFVPDLILLDIMMPGIDGYEVCRRVRSNPDLEFTKIILVSGKAMLEERIKGYEVGADDYITKPFVSEELAAKVTVFMRLAMVERQLKAFNVSLEDQVKERTAQLYAAEAKLINAAKMAALGEMAGGIAHEINTPLAAIGMRAGLIGDLLTDTPPGLEEIKNMAVQIETIVARIGKIVYGLLSFSRQRPSDKLEKRFVKNIIDDTMSLCQEKFKSAEIELTISEFPEALSIICDPVQISQVLLNLLSNSHDAIRESKESKWIRVGVEETPKGLEISVTDCGTGIKEEISHKMFQPFFTTKDIGQGTGLGLSISKGLMDSHRGELVYDQSSKNTRFVMIFPPAAHLKNGKTA